VSVVLRLSGPLSRDAVTRAGAQLEALLRRDVEVVVDVHDCDLTVVDAVCRMRLVARRHARALHVVGVDAGLLELCGLDDVR
jgi:ABC-type transporter Mla MlaB component